MYQMVYANTKGEAYEHPELVMVGRAGGIFCTPTDQDLIPLPEGAVLTLIPGGKPVGIAKDGQFVLGTPEKLGEDAIYAVGALLPQGYTRTLLPAYSRKENNPLPLMGYTAVGWRDGIFYVAAIKTDENHKWNPLNYNTPELSEAVAKTLNEFPENRIIKHLAKCALEYCCLTAQNIFYRRWEGGIPVSPTCNAACLGCISKQPAECCPSPQERIDFIPTPKEVAEIAISHLEQADQSIISFGQGCEGEPSLSEAVISEAVKEIRSQTALGTININTNAGFTEGIKNICDAGLDSMRVSIISPDESRYNSYYRPRNYSLGNVKESIKYAKSKKVYVSLNLLHYPGLTDSIEETDKLIKFIDETGIDMIQIRNLNIDPDFFEQQIEPAEGNRLGVSGMINYIKKHRPGIKIGNFSRPIKKSE